MAGVDDLFALPRAPGSDDRASIHGAAALVADHVLPPSRSYDVLARTASDLQVNLKIVSA